MKNISHSNHIFILAALISFLCITTGLFAGNGDVVILYTNDIHGAFLPRPAEWIKSHPLIGGFGQLSGALKTEQSKNQHTLLLDAGDFMTGNPITTLKVRGALGGAMLDFFKLLHYQAMTLGNHEFDEGVDNAVDLVEASHVPIISANLWLEAPQSHPGKKMTTALMTGKGWKIFKVGEVRVGVIGLMMGGLREMIGKSSMVKVSVTSPLEETRNIVAEIDPETDLIVLLTHEGAEEDCELAKKVSGVDVIVGGHSHTVIDTPMVRNHVIIVQAGSRCRYLGELKLKVENDQVAEYQGHLIPLWADSLVPTPEAQALVQKYQKIIDQEYGKTLDTLNQDWNVSGHEESEIGDWLADRLREFGQSDFAVVNSGGIRKPLLKGPLSMIDIKEMLPFSNQVVAFQCTGEQLFELVKTNTNAEVSRQAEILQVSGLSYGILKKSGTATQIMVNGAPLDKNRTYRGISVDYVAISQAKRYLGFVPDATEDLGIGFTDMIIQYIQQHGMKQKPPGGRIVWVEGD